MKFLRDMLDKQHETMFKKGAKFERLYPLYEANDTFLFTPGEKTKGGAHVRDGIDLKRMMIMVVVALIPCALMAIYNSGLQAQTLFANHANAEAGWIVTKVFELLGLELHAASADNIPFLSIMVHGLALFLPVYIVTMAVGGGLEALFCIVRKHEINEGFLVTGLLFPLTLPPTIPLWQVAVGIAFGVIIGKEVFGGTGMNILNPALTARAFVFFAYPAQLSGNVWSGANNLGALDGFSGATILAAGTEGGTQAILDADFTWMDAFIGMIPGSMGETSTLACLIGAFILIVTRVGSWRVMLACFLGMLAMSTLLNAFASSSTTNPFLDVSWTWHLVAGGFAFGAVFMATDPVSATNTDTGRWIYGFLIGLLCVLVRVLNPAYPEGMMLAILFMNVFAPLIDYYVVKANIKRRAVRLAG